MNSYIFVINHELFKVNYRICEISRKSLQIGFDCTQTCGVDVQYMCEFINLEKKEGKDERKLITVNFSIVRYFSFCFKSLA